MTRIFDYKKRFGQNINLEEIKNDFVNKINYFIFDNNGIDKFMEANPHIFDVICLSLGRNPYDLITEHNKNKSHVEYSNTIVDIPPVRYLTKDNFSKTLLTIEIIYNVLSPKVPEEIEWKKLINKVIKSALNQPISLNVVWRKGKFYPEGANELSDKLVFDVLKWLNDKPKVKELFKNALDHYSQSLNSKIKRKDTIINAFQAVEQITKDILNSNKESFDNNFNSLIDKISLNAEWKKICNSYKELSKEFGRHSGKNKNFIPSKTETEAFLYLSGLLIRLIIEKNNEK